MSTKIHGTRLSAAYANLSPVAMPVFYARPECEPIELRVQPRLASWNAAGHPDQLRLADALADATQLLGPSLRRTSQPLALRLDVGLPAHVSLLDEHDLDNYAYPLATHLDRGGTRLVSVWCTKQHAAHSYVRSEAATPAAPSDASIVALARTTASASTTAYKAQIHDQIGATAELPAGPVSLQLAYVVGPTRNWLNLWKPTIDAFDRLLGRTRPDRDWHPRDGRITELGLSCTIDASIGNDVVIAVAARSLLGGEPSRRARTATATAS